MTSSLIIAGGRVLHSNGILGRGTLRFSGRQIDTVSTGELFKSGDTDTVWDAEGLLVLPGMVDLHGDAFERCLMPRPGVHFTPQAALLEADRQMLAAGITTAYHGVTCSWEPGLRSLDQAKQMVQAVDALRGQLGCDTRLHLRHEVTNLDAEPQIMAWMRQGLIQLLAFNDHLDNIEDDLLQKPHKVPEYVSRTGMSRESLLDTINALQERRFEVEPALERLAALAVDLGIPMASHDDDTLEIRRKRHEMGCLLSEFPVDERTAQAARSFGDAVILGAPNIMRGGSHCDRMGAAQAVADGLCSVLTSDYHYPSMMNAIFRLAEEDIAFFPDAWALVSSNPAEAVGLSDRGVLEVGRRADVVLIDDSVKGMPRVAAAFVAGTCVYAAMDPVGALARGRAARVAAE